MESTYTLLLQRIDRWRLETAAYRAWNIILYLTAKVSIPLISTIIVTNISISTTGDPFISNDSMIILGIIVAVLSSLDSVLNPELQKFRAHMKNIELGKFKEELKIEWSETVCPKEKATILKKASLNLEASLKHYAREAYGSNGSSK
ncbi:hypothetical protein [Vibrio nigripulchritudo]|uniref:hypothetical protein n=1 Tax=Vibrio nigripulchritudo TaxID=28173 RepID=UPI0024905254|nr:hypothetical protein [Vibrio nigripulchritudo]BDU38712.1 hypothetical protein TUMSATVNIG2_31810 [Vibrio nigripulchritudo]BDU44432.1 hypothetical protein TUMSATVNIG3_32300 [Vibrio nigripulchritudo]